MYLFYVSLGVKRIWIRARIDPLDGRGPEFQGRNTAMSINRRQLLAGGAALATLPHFIGVSFARNGEVNVFSHRVHQTVSGGSGGGDVTRFFREATGGEVNWATFNTGPLHERVFREASLNESTVDVAYLLNSRVTPDIASLFEPLEPFMERAPLEDINDIFPGLRDAMTFDGQLHAVPIRHATAGFHYNEEILAERGVSPPETIEEFLEAAKQCTFTRDDGSSVVGFGLAGVALAELMAFARAWNADFVTPDMRVVANEPPMVTAVTAIRDLFEAGAMPRDMMTMNSEDMNLLMQSGRAAMTVTSFSRNRLYNDPEKSQVAGKVKTTFLPISETLKGEFEAAPTRTEFWSMAIPKNSQNKDLAWEFIRTMSLPEATIAAALNGNGPVRASAYENEQLLESLPYAKAEQKALTVARVPLPAFDEAARAADMLKEETETAVLGIKTPQEAMDDLTRRVQELIES